MDKIVVTARRDDKDPADIAGAQIAQADTEEVNRGGPPRPPGRASIARKGPGAARELARRSPTGRCAPPSSTTMRSALRTVFSRCAMTMRVASSPRSDSSTVGLRHVVERARRLVEQQDARLRDERAREQHALALAARDRRESLAHQRVDAHRHRLDVGGDARAGAPLPTRPRPRGSRRPAMLVKRSPAHSLPPCSTVPMPRRRRRRSSVARSLPS